MLAIGITYGPLATKRIDYLTAAKASLLSRAHFTAEDMAWLRTEVDRKDPGIQLEHITEQLRAFPLGSKQFNTLLNFFSSRYHVQQDDLISLFTLSDNVTASKLASCITKMLDPALYPDKFSVKERFSRACKIAVTLCSNPALDTQSLTDLFGTVLNFQISGNTPIETMTLHKQEYFTLQAFLQRLDSKLLSQEHIEDASTKPLTLADEKTQGWLAKEVEQLATKYNNLTFTRSDSARHFPNPAPMKKPLISATPTPSMSLEDKAMYRETCAFQLRNAFSNHGEQANKSAHRALEKLFFGNGSILQEFFRSNRNILFGVLENEVKDKRNKDKHLAHKLASYMEENFLILSMDDEKRDQLTQSIKEEITLLTEVVKKVASEKEIPKLQQAIRNLFCAQLEVLLPENIKKLPVQKEQPVKEEPQVSLAALSFAEKAPRQKLTRSTPYRHMAQTPSPSPEGQSIAIT